jgi:hypothetical protein
MASSKKSGKAVIKMTLDIFSIREINNGFLVTLDDKERVEVFVDTYTEALDEVSKRLVTLKKEALKPHREEVHA